MGSHTLHLPAHRVLVDHLQGNVDALLFDIAIDPDDDLIAAFALDLATEGILGDRILDESILDRDDRATARLHLAQPLTRPLFDLVGQSLDEIRTSQRIGGAGHSRLVRQDLLRPQRERCRVLGRQPQRLIVRVRVQALGATEHRGQRLVGHAHDVVQRLLRGQRDASGLGMEAHHLRSRIPRLHSARE